MAVLQFLLQFVLYFSVVTMVACSEDPVPTQIPTPPSFSPPPATPSAQTPTQSASDSSCPSSPMPTHNLDEFYAITLKTQGSESQHSSKLIELKVNSCTYQLVNQNDCALVHSSYFDTLRIESKVGNIHTHICRPNSRRNYYTNICTQTRGHARGYDVGHYHIEQFDGNLVAVESSESKNCQVVID